MYSLEHTGELSDSQGYTEKAEVFNVANVVYSLSRWESFELECMSEEEWPTTRGLPSAIDLPLGDVVAKAWSGQIRSLDQLRRAVVAALSKETISVETLYEVTKPL
jgi:hypothetical protein